MNAGVFFLAALFLVGPEPVFAATLRVNTFDQVHVGLCTLADAINSANANADMGGCTHTGTYGTDTIVLSIGIYNLTLADHTTGSPSSSGLPAITGDLTINGHGSTIARSVGAAPPFFRVLEVTAGSLTLNDLTISGGRLVSAFFDGGGAGISFSGTGSLALRNVTVTSNMILGGFGAAGGILFTSSGDLTLTRSAVTNNTVIAEMSGPVNLGARSAGIEHFSSSFLGSRRLTLTESTVANNVANADGLRGGGVVDAAGILYVGSGEVTLSSSTIVNNVASANGGGVVGSFRNDGGVIRGVGIKYHELSPGGGRLTITNSTIGNNSGSANGGPGGHAGFVRGAGILYQGSGRVILTNDTLSGNSASAHGVTGGVAAGGGLLVDGMVVLQNTIIAGNTAATGPDCVGAVTSLGNNLIGNTSECDGLIASDKQNVASGLGTLIDNGEPGNPHFPLLPGSPAIDMANPDACSASDQIGTARPQDGDGNGVAICDIGAIELLQVIGVPTLSELAQIIMAMLLALGGLAALSRRSRSIAR